MATTYYGLICRHCNGGYPLGEESTRNFRVKYLFNWGPFQLQCVRCGINDRYDRYVSWQREERYSAAQMAVARLRVTRS